MQGAAERTPRPKSPPEYAGLYGKRRHLTSLTLLEKEISSLQEELKSLDVVQPSSTCCQEVNEFVASREDPLLATDQNHHKSNCCFTRCWGKSCFRTKGNSSTCCCCFSDDKNINFKKPSLQRKQHREQRRGCCCKLDSFFCYGNGNRECCTLPCVLCSQPSSCCCTSCSTASCCTFNLCSGGCVGRSKCCTTCTTRFTGCC